MKKLKITRKSRGSFIKLEDDFIVYKAVRGGIAQLLLPKGTTVSVPVDYNSNGNHSRKLRADQAVVLMIMPIVVECFPNSYRTIKVYGNIVDAGDTYGSKWSISFKYKAGKLIKPKNGFHRQDNRPCKPGIHFFTNFKDAERWAGMY